MENHTEMKGRTKVACNNMDISQKKQDSTNTCNARFHLPEVQTQNSTTYGVKSQKSGGVAAKSREVEFLG